MTTTTPDQAEVAEKQLKKELSDSIRDFNLNRSALLNKAEEEGGLEAVTRLQNDYDDLRDAYRAILDRQLDRNNHRYAELMAEAAQEVARLRRSVTSFQATERLLEGLGKTLSVLGRALIVLG